MNLDQLSEFEEELFWDHLHPAFERLFAGASLPRVDAMRDPLRKYAEEVFENRAWAFRWKLSTEQAAHAFLDGQVQNIVCEILGRVYQGREGGSAPVLSTRGGIVEDELDQDCLLYEVVKDSLEFRHLHNHRCEKSAGGIQEDLPQFAGVSTRRSLAMDLLPHLQAKRDYWLTVYFPRTTDRITDVAAIPEEPPGPPKRKPAKRRKQQPVNKEIDDKLREIAKARPRSHREVFETLERRKTRLSRQQFFQRAGGWMTAYRRYPQKARTWLSQRWSKLGLPSYFRGARDEELQ